MQRRETSTLLAASGASEEPIEPSAWEDGLKGGLPAIHASRSSERAADDHPERHRERYHAEVFSVCPDESRLQLLLKRVLNPAESSAAHNPDEHCRPRSLNLRTS